MQEIRTETAISVRNKIIDIFHTWLKQVFKGTVVERALSSLHVLGHVKLHVHTVPLSHLQSCISDNLHTSLVLLVPYHIRLSLSPSFNAKIKP